MQALAQLNIPVGLTCDDLHVVNFATYRILQRHRAVSLPQHRFLVYISDRSNAEIRPIR